MVPYPFWVARLRTIFTLPFSLAHYPHPLIYVDYFSEMDATPNDICVYKVHKLTGAGSVKSAVLRLNQLARSCHLAAVHDDDLVGVLDADTILNTFEDFYVNDSLDLHSYLHL